ncbi:bifunctional DNA-formamidopyrimidine glycosylase/DNA-(apurinic or apyrimidinic site) lyase [Chitinibacteraceae bacterium HSL-7]
MPELPEVETTRRGISPHLTGLRVTDVVVREHRLRWPVPDELAQKLIGAELLAVRRRGKYLLFDFPHGSMLVHLGMSGTLRVLRQAPAAERHEHVDWLFSDGTVLRYRDPRRFGCVLWQDAGAGEHPLLAHLGPEPLSDLFHTDYLANALAHRQSVIKLAIMDHHIVVGVGNIYASEALFRAGVHPERRASALTREDVVRLVDAIKATLNDAITQGGSTLRDFVDSDGKSGYFLMTSFVYGRNDAPCRVCGAPIRQIRQGQRSTFFCAHCQH